MAVLWDRSSRPSWQTAEAAAGERGWRLLSLEIRDAAEIEGVFRAATEARVERKRKFDPVWPRPSWAEIEKL